MGEPITVIANDRPLSIVGTIPQYLKWYDGWNADTGAIAHAARDLPGGTVCVDAGANIGIMALTLAVQHPDCHVIAIEPVPDNFACLKQNVDANNIKNVEIVNAAVGDKGGTVAMTNNGPWSSVWAEGPDTVDCPYITLDEFAGRDVGFLKIDTEGYEPHVIAGASRLLRQSRPLIHMEFNTWYLLVHHFDPISFAKAIWGSCDVLGMYYQEQFLSAPAYDVMIVHDNITAHGSVTDLLLRPKADFPSLPEMIFSPDHLALLATRSTVAPEVYGSPEVAAPFSGIRRLISKLVR